MNNIYTQQKRRSQTTQLTIQQKLKICLQRDKLMSASVSPRKKYRKTILEDPSSFYVPPTVQNHKNLVLEAIKTQSFSEIINILLDLLPQITSLTILANTLLAYAKVFFTLRNFHQAVQLFNSLRILSNLMNLPKHKIQSLIGLGDCAIKFKNFDFSLVFYKRALQYIWIMNDDELAIYEKIALAYFYLGLVGKSQLYHKRVCQSEVEQQNSPIKFISIKNLSEFNRIQKKLNKDIPIPQLIGYLSLHQDGIRQENGQILLEQLIAQDKDFNPIIPSPRCKIILQIIFQVPQQRNDPFNINLQKMKLRMKTPEKQRRNMSHRTDTDASIYKYPLDKLIEMRSRTIEQKIELSQQQRSNIRTPVYLRHLNKEEQCGRRNLRNNVWQIMNELL